MHVEVSVMYQYVDKVIDRYPIGGRYLAHENNKGEARIRTCIDGEGSFIDTVFTVVTKYFFVTIIMFI